MYFNNPEIIKTETDIVLGSVRVSEQNISFLNLINRTISLYSYYIKKDVEALISDEISHRRALMLVANKIYSKLDMYQELPPSDEEQLAELMMQSDNFDMWESDIKRRFFETHLGKVDVQTPVPVTGDGAVSQDEIKSIKDEVNLDMILEKLAMYKDIGYPTTDSYGAPKEIKN